MGAVSGLLRRRVPRNASAASIALHGKGTELATQLAIVALLPRLLGPEDFGRMAVALAVVAIGASILSLGAPVTFARFVPPASPAERVALARALTVRAARLRVLQLAPVVALATLLVLVDPRRFPSLETELVLAALVLELLALLAAQAALGLGETWLWSFRRAFQNVVLLAAVPALYAAAGTAGAVAGVAISTGGGVLLGALVVGRRLLSAGRGARVPDGASRFGFVVGISMGLMQLSHRGPVIAVALLAGSSVQTGYAALATSAALAVVYAVRQLFTTSLPELSERWATDPAGVDRAARVLAWRAVAVTGGGAVVAALLLDPLLRIGVGERYAGAAGALGPALALLPLAALPLLAWQAASLRLRPGLAVWISGAAVVAFATVAVAAVPVWGAAGATVALLVSTAVAAATAALLMRDIVTPRLLAAAGAAAAVILLVAVWS